MSRTPPSTPPHASSTADDWLAMGPSAVSVRIPGPATGNRLAVVEMRIDPGWSGPPPHVHAETTHLWYVLDGQVELAVDGESTVHGAGACLWVPPGTVHGFSTAEGPGATVLQVDLDRPLDGYFAELHDAFPPGTPPDPARVGEIMARHDTTPVRPG